MTGELHSSRKLIRGFLESSGVVSWKRHSVTQNALHLVLFRYLKWNCVLHWRIHFINTKLDYVVRHILVDHEKELLPSSRLFFCMYQCGSNWMDFSYNFILGSFTNIQIWWKSDKNVRHFMWLPKYVRGTAVAQWLRCCPTNRKVVCSIPDGVIGIFHWHKILPIALWPWGRLSL